MPGTSANLLPPPATFGIDGDRFEKWRDGQAQAVNDIICSPSMFDLIVAPTGYGKSLMYITYAILSGKRTLILTSTKPLQRQIMTDFDGLCMEVMGKGNYRCLRLPQTTYHGCDKGPCNYGENCGYKDGGCRYYDAVRAARSAMIVVTNYSYWIYNNKIERADGSGIGDFENIICDEAHDAPNKVADAFSSKFNGRTNEVDREILSRFGWTDDRNDYRKWAEWALERCREIFKNAKEEGNVNRQFRANNTTRKLKETLRYAALDYKIVIVPDSKQSTLHVALLWPFDLADEVLFCNAHKVVLTSATVRPKTVQMLGVGDDKWKLFEYPHNIPAERRMLYHVPCVRMNYRTSDREMQMWLTKFETIAKPRQEWNGIFHVGSYARKQYVLKYCKYVDRMVSHGRDDTGKVILRFKNNYDGTILVSPSVTTGYDFPYNAARWQVIGKIAYPDTSDPVTKARCEVDKEYAPYVAMQTLVQTCGRIVRAKDDWGESFIIDDNIRWFKKRYGHFAPDWFRGSIREVAYAPAPRDWK